MAIDSTNPSMVMARAVERLSPKTLIVAAAGNHGLTVGWVNGLTEHSPTWPAALPNVVAVGADDPLTGTLAGFSPRLPWVTCTAPGEGVVAAYLTADVTTEEEPGVLPTHFEGYARWSGTSFATAAVSGAVAARMRPRVDAWEALDELLNHPGPNPVVKKFQHTP